VGKVLTMKKAVAVIVIHEDEVIIGKKIVKKNHFLSGGWHIPGGHVLKNESEEAAVVREMKEETNVDVQVICKLACNPIPENDVEVHWYVCEPTTFDPVSGDDLEEVRFVKKTNVFELCDERAKSLWPKEVIAFLTRD